MTTLLDRLTMARPGAQREAIVTALKGVSLDLICRRADLDGKLRRQWDWLWDGQRDDAAQRDPLYAEREAAFVATLAAYRDVCDRADRIRVAILGRTIAEEVQCLTPSPSPADNALPDGWTLGS